MSEQDVEPDKPPKNVKVKVTIDTEWAWALVVLAVALSWMLCTGGGNRWMCRQNEAPTFIDCPKAVSNG